MLAQVLARHRHVVVVAAHRRETLLGERAQPRRILPIDDGRAQPFQQRRIGVAQQLQRLAQLPAADVEFAADRLLDDVASRIHAQVPRQLVHIDEAHVVVRVRRGEAPAAAARFAGEQHVHVVAPFQVGQRGEHGGAHLVRDGVRAAYGVDVGHALSPFHSFSRREGPCPHPFTQTTCFNVCTISTRSLCAAITASMSL